MEIVAELLFNLLLWLAEVLLQVVFEALAELGLRVARAPWRERPEISSWVAVPGYAAYGAGVGGLSLLVMPVALLTSPLAQAANLVATPLAAGLAMSMIGAWRRRRGEALLRLDRFSYGALFAFAMALVRYLFAAPE